MRSIIIGFLAATALIATTPAFAAPTPTSQYARDEKRNADLQEFLTDLKLSRASCDNLRQMERAQAKERHNANLVLTTFHFFGLINDQDYYKRISRIYLREMEGIQESLTLAQICPADTEK